MLLNLIAAACELPDRLPVELAAGEQIVESAIQAPQAWQDLLAGRIQRLDCLPAADGTARCVAVDLPTAAAAPAIVFPGAFHPRHDGHRAMAAAAAEHLGRPVIHEISIVNVDKPPLDFFEIDTRLRQFAAGERVSLTRTPTFVEKAGLFPNSTFVVGADTIERIAEPKYYGGQPAAAEAAFRAIAAAGCRFLVFGRLTAGEFRTLADLNLPPALAAICRPVSEAQFRRDISSTELRLRQGE